VKFIGRRRPIEEVQTITNLPPQPPVDESVRSEMTETHVDYEPGYGLVERYPDNSFRELTQEELAHLDLVDHSAETAGYAQPVPPQYDQGPVPDATGRIERNIELRINIGWLARPEDAHVAGQILDNALRGAFGNNPADRATDAYVDPASYYPQEYHADANFEQAAHYQGPPALTGNTQPDMQPELPNTSAVDNPQASTAAGKKPPKDSSDKGNKLWRFVGKPTAYLVAAVAICAQIEKTVIEPTETWAFRLMSGDDEIPSYWSEQGKQSTKSIPFIGEHLEQIFVRKTNHNQGN
jgi:hypothetical protein